MSNSKDSRRQFLRNITLAAAAIGASPLISNASKNLQSAKEDCNPTTKDYYGEGPFYTDNPPEIADGKLSKSDETGTKIRITGRVQNLDCSEFIPDTIVDIWHANDAGAYDNDGYNLRGQVKTNAQGFYVFETIKPGKYLNGSKFRPSHIHFKITPPNHPTITTQLYFKGDTSIAEDAAAKLDSGQYDASNRIIELTENTDGVLEGTWDIAINGEGTMRTDDLHLDKGMIYKVSPNPFTKELIINYGVFQKNEISLLVFDMQGRQVASLEQHTLTPEKYEALWAPDAALAHGQYFIALKVNDIQVHYIKVQYQK